VSVRVLVPATDRPVLGEILEDFLMMYGEEMICGSHGFSMRDGGFRFNVKDSDATHPVHPQAGDPIVLEDPVNVINNVAKNSFRISLVQQAFLNAHETLQSLVVRYERKKKRETSLLTEIFGIEQ
jgi:DNA polymerase sigma